MPMSDDGKVFGDPSPVSGVSAFLGKLWKMVGDPKTDHLISWGETGTTFVIKNQINFAKIILPKYYKHNNIASFIRQLNMYGFHKIVSTTSGSLDSVDNDEIEFSHPKFIRGRPYLLDQIKRKMNNLKENLVKPESADLNEPLKRVLNDVRQLKGRQEQFTSQLCSFKQENEILWRELSLLRQKHATQQNILNKLIRFLVSLAQPNNHGLVKRRLLPLMLKDSSSRSKPMNETTFKNENHTYTSSKRENLSPGPTIHEIHSSEVMDDIQSIGSPVVDVATSLPLMSDHNTMIAYSPEGMTSSEPILTSMFQRNSIENHLQPPDSPNHITAKAQPQFNRQTPNAFLELVECADTDDDDEYVPVLDNKDAEVLANNFSSSIVTRGLSNAIDDSKSQKTRVTNKGKVSRKRNNTGTMTTIEKKQPLRKSGRNTKRRLSTGLEEKPAKFDNADHEDEFSINFSSPQEFYVEILTPGSNHASFTDEVQIPANFLNVVDPSANKTDDLKVEENSSHIVKEDYSDIVPSAIKVTPLDTSTTASSSTAASSSNSSLTQTLSSGTHVDVPRSNIESNNVSNSQFTKQGNESSDSKENMSVVCAQNPPTSNSDMYMKDISYQLDTMQSDLNSLRDYMHSQPFGIDLLSGIFNDNPVDYLPEDDYNAYSDDKIFGNELISTPSTMDLNEIFPEWIHTTTPSNKDIQDYCSLNTPQIENNTDDSQQSQPKK